MKVSELILKLQLLDPETEIQAADLKVEVIGGDGDMIMPTYDIIQVSVEQAADPKGKPIQLALIYYDSDQDLEPANVCLNCNFYRDLKGKHLIDEIQYKGCVQPLSPLHNVPGDGSHTCELFRHKRR